jgi:hypothetical protein
MMIYGEDGGLEQGKKEQRFHRFMDGGVGSAWKGVGGIPIWKDGLGSTMIK